MGFSAAITRVLAEDGTLRLALSFTGGSISEALWKGPKYKTMYSAESC